MSDCGDRRTAEVIPFRVPDVRVTPGSAAEAALDWLASRVTWRAPASAAETVADGELVEILDGAAAATHIEPVEDVVVLVREFPDGTLDALYGRYDETGTLGAPRRAPLGRGPLLRKTDRLREVMEEAVALPPPSSTPERQE